MKGEIVATHELERVQQERLEMLDSTIEKLFGKRPALLVVALEVAPQQFATLRTHRVPPEAAARVLHAVAGSFEAAAVADEAIRRAQEGEG
ncbi:MAG: hypothetical protein ACREBN_02985 [Burkholderiaceae bacterium]